MLRGLLKTQMSEPSVKKIFDEVLANIEVALKTNLTVVVCGPGKPNELKPDSPYLLREAVRHSLKEGKDNVFFLEDLVASEAGQQAKASLKQALNKDPRLDQIEILILKDKMIDKDVHIAEGEGSLVELRDLVNDTDVFKKVYAFVNERHLGDPGYIQQSVYVQLSRDNRLFSFKNESDLISKVKEALNPNRISKSGLVPQ
jgi:hypothetical protein